MLSLLSFLFSLAHKHKLLQMRGYKLDNPLQTQAALQAYLDLTECMCTV